MSKLLLSPETATEMRRALQQLKDRAVPDAQLAIICETDRSSIKRWREGSSIPNRFDQALLIFRGLALGLYPDPAEESEGDRGAGTLPAVKTDADDEVTEDESLLEGWAEFLEREGPINV